jgi:hypothetical protein
MQQIRYRVGVFIATLALVVRASGVADPPRSTDPDQLMAFPPIRIEGLHIRLSTPTIIGVAAVGAMLVYGLIKF